jgi:hypothetical protein
MKKHIAILMAAGAIAAGSLKADDQIYFQLRRLQDEMAAQQRAIDAQRIQMEQQMRRTQTDPRSEVDYIRQGLFYRNR